MPQMMPMSWFLLYFFFLICFMLILSLIYFLTSSAKSTELLFSPIKINYIWQW